MKAEQTNTQGQQINATDGAKDPLLVSLISSFQ